MANEALEKLPRTKQEAKARGEKFYFTGTPCKHGHVAKRTLNGDCHTCVLDRVTKWQKDNPERTNKRNRRWVAKQLPEYRANKVAAWRANNSERAYESWERYHSEHVEDYRRNNRKWYAEHREREVARSLVYAKANPDKVNAIANTRRARKVGAEGVYTEVDVLEILKLQRYLCLGCDSDIRTRYTVDHVVPLSRGGSNWPENLICLCRSCNASKNALTMDEWLLRRLDTIA